MTPPVTVPRRGPTVYLGDRLFASMQHDAPSETLVLSFDDGQEEQTELFLTPIVWAALLRFMTKVCRND